MTLESCGGQGRIDFQTKCCAVRSGAVVERAVGSNNHSGFGYSQ